MSSCSLASVIRLNMMSSGICSDCSWVCGRWDSPGSSSAQPLTLLPSIILTLGDIMATHHLFLLFFQIATFEILTWCCCIKTQWANETILVSFERKVRAHFIPATQAIAKKVRSSPKGVHTLHTAHPAHCIHCTLCTLRTLHTLHPAHPAHPAHCTPCTPCTLHTLHTLHTAELLRGGGAQAQTGRAVVFSRPCYILAYCSGRQIHEVLW